MVTATLRPMLPTARHDARADELILQLLLELFVWQLLDTHSASFSSDLLGARITHDSKASFHHGCQTTKPWDAKMKA